MKFIIIPLMAAISSTSTMAFVISNGFLNGGLLNPLVPNATFLSQF
jgi:hypothetical protein